MDVGVGDVVVAGKYTRSLTGEARLSLLARACNNLPQNTAAQSSTALPNSVDSTSLFFSFLSPPHLPSPVLHHALAFPSCPNLLGQSVQGQPYCKGASANGNELQITNISHLEE